MCLWQRARLFKWVFFSPALLILKRKARHGVSGRMRGHCKAFWGTVKVQDSAIQPQSISHLTIFTQLFKISNACRVGGEDAITRESTKALIHAAEAGKKTEATQSIIAKEGGRRAKSERLH